MGVHVFIGEFESREKAVLYTEEQWEPEPEESVSDEEYSAWEDRNPNWEMAADLDCYLDSDFIETITEGNFAYLKGVVQKPLEVEKLKDQLNVKNSVLVLIFDDAINFQTAPLKSTASMTYLGYYKSIV